jgi:hypothetical protein
MGEAAMNHDGQSKSEMHAELARLRRRVAQLERELGESADSSTWAIVNPGQGTTTRYPRGNSARMSNLPERSKGIKTLAANACDGRGGNEGGCPSALAGSQGVAFDLL